MLRESPPPLPIKTDDLPPRPALKEEREVLLASAPPPMLKVVPLVPEQPSDRERPRGALESPKKRGRLPPPVSNTVS